MRILILFLLPLAIPGLSAQTVADFENIPLEPESFDNGRDGSGGFASGNVFLPNSYTDIGLGAWEGWAISNTTDTLTPGFENQYSAAAGSGFDGSEQYAVAFQSSSQNPVLRLTGAAEGGIVEGMYVTNSTYAYLSMRDGDSFAKRFGGETGDDPDFFLLTIKGYVEGDLTPDSIDFYLADYRFEDNSQDYILREWTYLELSGLGPVDSLEFVLRSSDVGAFGINTPTYFCVDHITTRDEGAVSARAFPYRASLAVYPNPAADWLTLDWAESRPGRYTLSTLNGKQLEQRVMQPGKNNLALGGLASGYYLLGVEYRGQRHAELVFIR